MLLPRQPILVILLLKFRKEIGRQVMKLRIKELREEMHYTQKDVADKIGNTPRNVCNWENGTNEPDCETLVKLADALYVSLDDLFGRTDGFDFKKTTEKDLGAILRQISKLTDDQIAALSAFLATIAK